MAKTLRLALLSTLAAPLLAAAPTAAHPPDWASHPVRPRIDVIPPLGNNLPYSYAARYNRPAYLTGKIAYCIAPTSREAMSWHRAAHRGYYADHAPAMQTHYLYPKPWELLGITSAHHRAAHSEGAHHGDVSAAEDVLPIGPDAPAGPGSATEPSSPAIELAAPIELLPVPQSVP